REEFRKVVNSVSKGDLATLAAIDPTKLIFRIDMRETGWGTKPFHRIGLGQNGEVKDLPAQDTVFDLILLEYPFAAMPTKDVEEIVDTWLKPIAQIRPIIYLRTDWFVKEMEKTPLKSDINRLIGPAVKARGADAPQRKPFEPKLDDLPQVN